jgi:NitT/TauT family transport system ATP-binding protein
MWRGGIKALREDETPVMTSPIGRQVSAHARSDDRAVSADSAIELKDIAVRFGKYTAVEGLDLTVRSGEFLSIVGPTGCGKSTLLNTVTGLNPPSAGTVKILGEPLVDLNSHSGYMLQQDALLPWKTTLDNVALGLVFRGVKQAEARDEARGWIEKVGLKGFENSYPYQLSGGMKKRTALAQVFILQPKMILLDEPFSALDVHTRRLMQNELLRLWTEQKISVVFITHDLEEAIALSDRVAVMAAGPASRIVASFPVDLVRPRDVAEILLNADFRRIYGDIWNVLRGEVQKTYQRHV